MYLFCFLRSFFAFNRAVFNYFFGNKEDKPRLFYCGYSLVKGVDYRLLEKSKTDYLIALRLYKRNLLVCFSHCEPVQLNKGNGQIAILDQNYKSVELRNQYIENLSGEKVSFLFGKEELTKSPSVFASIVILLFLVFSFLPVFCIF